MEKDNSSDLRGLLEQKLNTFKDFFSVTVLLKEAVVSEDVEDIKSLIEKRRSYIKAIDRIDCGIKKISEIRITSPSAETRKIPSGLWLKTARKRSMDACLSVSS